MAKKAAPAVDPALDQKLDLVERLGEFSHFKSINRETLMSVLEEIFRTMIRRRYGTDENFNIIINVDKGDIQAFRERTIVPDGEVEDESLQMPLSEALEKDEDLEVGESWADKINLLDFDRRQVMAAKQLLAQKIKELEKSVIFDHYKNMVGEIIIGEVYQIWRNELLVMHDGNELSLPKHEQILKDRYKKGDTIRAVVQEVEMRNGSPRVLVSRASPQFLQRSFELEVPEIDDGLISIRGIVRDPGERAKVAVESYDDRIDPVGACVGMRGSRIHGIVRELRNENIDVIHYSSNPQIYIQRALAPAKVQSIVLDEVTKHAKVYLKADQISLAIGKQGQNVKLAQRLTGFELDLFREDEPGANEEDVDLDEFSDEIEAWVIEELKNIGTDTAKSVMALTIDELERRTNLNREVIESVLAVLKKEFED